jgi:7-cyano-7-deazaguanine synthase
MKKAVAIVSGGLDSITLAYCLKSQGYVLHVLAFDYGQSHTKEVIYAERGAQRLQAQYDRIDISDVGRMLKGSALTDDDVSIPEGHYAADNMALTVVPNRNAIMLSIGFSVAAAEEAEVVAIGVHGGDHFIYPDCRPDFIESFERMERLSLGESSNVKLYAPFLNLRKENIVEIGAELGVPFSETWSCYKGGEYHCGTCGTCVERKEAFELAGVEDPTIYSNR